MHFTITHSEKCSHACICVTSLYSVVWVSVTLLNRAELRRPSYDNMRCWGWKSLNAYASSVLAVSVVHLDSVNASSVGTQMVKMAFSAPDNCSGWVSATATLVSLFACCDSPPHGVTLVRMLHVAGVRGDPHRVFPVIPDHTWGWEHTCGPATERRGHHVTPGQALYPLPASHLSTEGKDSFLLMVYSVCCVFLCSICSCLL